MTNSIIAPVWIRVNGEQENRHLHDVLGIPADLYDRVKEMCPWGTPASSPIYDDTKKMVERAIAETSDTSEEILQAASKIMTALLSRVLQVHRLGDHVVLVEGAAVATTGSVSEVVVRTAAQKLNAGKHVNATVVASGIQPPMRELPDAVELLPDVWETAYNDVAEKSRKVLAREAWSAIIKMDAGHLVEANRQGSGAHAQVLKARAIRRRVEMNLD